MALLPLLPRPSCLHTSKEWMINAYKHSSRPPPSSCLQHLPGVRWPWPWPLLSWFREALGRWPSVCQVGLKPRIQKMIQLCIKQASGNSSSIPFIFETLFYKSCELSQGDEARLLYISNGLVCCISFLVHFQSSVNILKEFLQWT